MTYQATALTPLETREVYCCNLCQRELENNQLVGIRWFGGGGEGKTPTDSGISRIAFVPARDAADHICAACVKELSDLRSGLARDLAVLG